MTATFAAEDTALDLAPLVTPDVERDATITERFAAFHDANPSVLHHLIAVIDEVKQAGGQGYSVKGAYEVLRWSSLRTSGLDYKLNNDFTALYARAICDERPDLASMLNLRERRAP